MPGLFCSSVWKNCLHSSFCNNGARRLFSSVTHSRPRLSIPAVSSSASSTPSSTTRSQQTVLRLREKLPRSPQPVAFYSEVPVAGVNTMENPVNDCKESLLKDVAAELGSPLSTAPQAPPPKPLILVISGPSGVGKDAVINRLREVRNELHFVVTATTRPKRPGEVDGKDYFFVSKQQFESMIENNELLEHAVVYGDFKGVPKQQVRDCLSKGLDVVLRVDVQGAATVRSMLGSSAVFIFLVAESEAALVKRLVERKTETKDKLLVRIATARDELKRMQEFDYVVVNADSQLDQTVSLISHIIDAEKSKVHQKEAIL